MCPGTGKTGMVQAEVGIWAEELCVHSLDLTEATAHYADKSLNSDYLLSGWWREGLGVVTVIPPSAPGK